MYFQKSDCIITLYITVNGTVLQCKLLYHSSARQPHFMQSEDKIFTTVYKALLFCFPFFLYIVSCKVPHLLNATNTRLLSQAQLCPLQGLQRLLFPWSERSFSRLFPAELPSPTSSRLNPISTPERAFPDSQTSLAGTDYSLTYSITHKSVSPSSLQSFMRGLVKWFCRLTA